MRFARQNGGTTLEMTPGGNFLSRVMNNGFVSREVSGRLWTHGGAGFVNGASGRVRALLGNSIRPNSVFRQTEVGLLYSNPNVTGTLVIRINP